MGFNGEVSLLAGGVHILLAVNWKFIVNSCISWWW